VVASLASPDMMLFRRFINDHQKVYNSAVEFQHRFQIFKENLLIIEELNSRNSSAKFGITRFADLTPKEFKEEYLAPLPEYMTAGDDSIPVAKISDEDVMGAPASVDWRNNGAVTPIKNQGQCGSCWAFSAVGNLEGQWFLAGNTLVGLSEQNLVDCDHECINGSCDAGCDGGLMPNAWTYIMDNGGIDTESSYPYTAEDGTCKYNASSIGAKVKSWTMIPGNETLMAAYCAANGPVSVAVEADSWQFYIEGVFEDPFCGTALDHGVLIVGYGNEIDWFGEYIEFWIIKNSWGTSWGEDGYIRLERGSNQCGINLFPCSSIV